VSAGAAAFVCLALVAGCCVVGLAATLALRRRLERVARAEHELRGPATALLLMCERMRRQPGVTGYAVVLESQLDRLRAGLADLEDARLGRRRPIRAEAVELSRSTRAALEPWRSALRGASLDWRGGAARMRVDRGRLGQALGNLLGNAAEHGVGEIEVKGRTGDAGVRLEVRNRTPEMEATGERADRGRGLRIARQAAGDLGGRLDFRIEDGMAVAALELPVSRAGSPDGTDWSPTDGELEAA